MGIEPTLSAWEAEVLPLNYTRTTCCFNHSEFWIKSQIMEIIVNGTEQQVEPGCTLAALISQLNLEHQRIAVEINLAIVPRSQFAEYTLSANDKVEIIHAIGGGIR